MRFYLLSIDLMPLYQISYRLWLVFVDMISLRLRSNMVNMSYGERASRSRADLEYQYISRLNCNKYVASEYISKTHFIFNLDLHFNRLTGRHKARHDPDNHTAGRCLHVSFLYTLPYIQLYSTEAYKQRFRACCGRPLWWEFYF